MELINIDLPPGLAPALTGIEKQFIIMRSSGASVRDIAAKLKKSTHTICNWNKKFAKEIISARNSEFCDLQKKVIESKTARLNNLKCEFERASKILKKHKMDVEDTFGGYNKFLELYIKLSDLMSSCESDILSVGVKFKDNIVPEISLNELEKENDVKTDNTVADWSSNVAEVPDDKNIDNTKLKPVEQQIAAKRNTTTSKKFEAYKKQ
jgi:hypothetical protein